MGVVIKPVYSYKTSPSGIKKIWFDKTLNELMKRKLLTEVKK